MPCQWARRAAGNWMPAWWRRIGVRIPAWRCWPRPRTYRPYARCRSARRRGRGGGRARRASAGRRDLSGLSYDLAPLSAASVAPGAFVVNSFSKYFGMTGWRLGWLVAPEAAVEPLSRLAQNVFLAASTPAQHAALAAFRPECRDILEQRRIELQRRRDALLDGLVSLGWRRRCRLRGRFICGWISPATAAIARPSVGNCSRRKTSPSPRGPTSPAGGRAPCAHRLHYRCRPAGGGGRPARALPARRKGTR